MTRPSHKISKRFLFVYFMLGGLIFLFTPAGVTGKLQLAYARMFRGPLAAGRVATLAAQTPTYTKNGRSKTYEQLQAENRQLQNITATYKAHLTKAEDEIAKLQQLRSNPDWKRIIPVRASILSDPSGSRKDILINRGKADGIAVGQFVLGDFSVIGTISNVLGPTAKVRLITDPESRVWVQVDQSNARGWMIGADSGATAVRQVDSRLEVKKGAHIYALRAPGYPEIPFPTGIVVDSKPDEDPLFQAISVEPVCDIANLESVYVIVPAR